MNLYKCMKAAFIFLLILLSLPMPVLSLSFSVTQGGLAAVKKSGVTLAFSYEKLYVETPFFSFGAMEDGGIIHTLDHPFSSSSLSPSLSAAGTESRAVGSLFTYRGMSVFSFSGERSGAGISYEGGDWTGGVLYVSKGEDGRYQRALTSRTDRDIFYLYGEYDGTFLSARFLSSSLRFLSFTSLFRVTVKLPLLSFSFGKGNIHSFSTSGDGWSRFFAAEINSDCFSVSHELRYASDPVYLRQYRDYEYSIEAELEIGKITLSDTMEKTFIDGKTKRRERIELSWAGISVGWNTHDSSLYASISHAGTTVEWEDGRLTVSIEKTIEWEGYSFTLILSSSGVSKWIHTSHS